jgi:hypothetical protein
MKKVEMIPTTTLSGTWVNKPVTFGLMGVVMLGTRTAYMFVLPENSLLFLYRSPLELTTKS